MFAEKFATSSDQQTRIVEMDCRENDYLVEFLLDDSRVTHHSSLEATELVEW
jgi:hypothetical protein